MSNELYAVLTTALGVRAVVDKEREIYYLGNVKVHVDDVRGLGSFLEIEALDATGQRSEKELEAQCRALMTEFGVSERDLVAASYGDMAERRYPDDQRRGGAGAAEAA